MENKIKSTPCDIRQKIKAYALRAGALTMVLVISAAFIPKSGGGVLASGKLTDSKVQSYEAKIDALNDQMAALKNKMQNATTDIEKTIAKKEQLDGEMNILIEKIEVTTALIEELSLSIAQKNGEISDKQKAYEEQYALCKERIRLAHEDGQASYLEMLLDSDNLADFLSSVDRVSALLEYDRHVMETLKNQKSDLEAIRNNFEDQKNAQVEYMGQLKADEASLEAKKKEAENYLKTLEGNKSYYAALYQKNLEAEEELQKELQAYLKELAARQNNKYVGGKFMWPVPQTYVRVSSEYGGRTSPITGKYEFHNGIDIPAAYGTAIYAANDGTVTVSTKHWSYGNYIMIDHGGGYATLYAHCSKLLVNKGDKVKKGQVIAYVGSTGYSTGNHLHFSMYENSAHTDPRKWFPK